MVQMLPDPTFYPSAALAGEAPAGALAYVALLAAAKGKTNGAAMPLRFLRSAWINMNVVWVGALIVTAAATPFL